jgi:ubiquinone/menaquinone biosynthesis C-methylase UbiE
MDPNVQRFTGFADLYDQYRPELPIVIREILLQLAGLERPVRVVDLGSGTGLSTRLWRGCEATVIGIEPSPDMRVIAERFQATDRSQSNISFKEGTSTSTGLANTFANIVTVSQALHWMEPEPTFLEIARILRSGGIFAAIDCDWPPTFHPELEQAYAQCMTRAEVAEAKHRVSTGVRRWSKEGHLSRIQESRLFAHTKEIVCHSVENGDAKRLVGLAKSQGTVATLLKHGLSEDELGISDLRLVAEKTLGDRMVSWFWSYRIRVGLKQ